VRERETEGQKRQRDREREERERELTRPLLLQEVFPAELRCLPAGKLNGVIMRLLESKVTDDNNKRTLGRAHTSMAEHVYDHCLARYKLEIGSAERYLVQLLGSIDRCLEDNPDPTHQPLVRSRRNTQHPFSAKDPLHQVLGKVAHTHPNATTLTRCAGRASHRSRRSPRCSASTARAWRRTRRTVRCVGCP
jgi:hypothetical protein